MVLHNLRLPELDKNHNVGQQKALVFDANSCRYDVILGADFLSKTGIDVKYSTGTIDGTLGVSPHRKLHIDLVLGAVPKHFGPYAIPVIHLEAFKKELIHLVKIGVLSPQVASEWASPTFITPKKDGRVRWVSNLRELNKVAKRKQYPLPIIGNIHVKDTNSLLNWIS